jgi:hypothetical protein
VRKFGPFLYHLTVEESIIAQVSKVCLLPDFEGNRPLVGSWLIGDKPSGAFLFSHPLLSFKDEFYLSSYLEYRFLYLVNLEVLL